jgi:hypothetical protein
MIERRAGRGSLPEPRNENPGFSGTFWGPIQDFSAHSVSKSDLLKNKKIKKQRRQKKE